MKKLAMVLAVLMLLSVLPVVAMAADGTTVYFDVNANWPNDGARFAVYYFNDSENGWTDLVAEGDLYTAVIPAGYTSMIICRMNPGTSENNWDNKWNQTGDLTVPTDDKNCFAIPYGNWDGADNSNWYVKGQQPNNDSQEGPVEYYVAGAPELCGDSWKENSAANKMTKNADGLYEMVYENVAAGSYEFKVTNGTWAESWGGAEGNYVLVVETAGTVKILFNAESKEISVVGPAAEGGEDPVEPAPTGDTTPLAVLVALMAVSAVALVATKKRAF